MDLCATPGLKPEFSVKIVVCDHYLTQPIPGIDVTYSDFRGTDVKQVPILRIFGSTQNGYKVCLHVHGVFPYFYIPCPTPNPEPQLLYQIAASLDKALNIALKQATSNSQHVYKISLVKGLPFYGFHYKDHLYLKIFLYNPGLIKQAVELCSNAAILGTALQPHESHLNFTLQFFIDFNLFGMSNIDLQSVLFRRSGFSQRSNEPLHSGMILKPESVCYYEADCIASQILNRQRISKGDGIENPGLEEVWIQEMERRKNLNMSIVSKSLSQGRIGQEETDSHYKFEQIFNCKIANASDAPIAVDINNTTKENSHYPALSAESSTLYDARDVSIHLPNTLLRDEMHETNTCTDMNDTVVDECIALNSSLPIQCSEVLLNTEDLNLLGMLQEMDENNVEEDSAIATPACTEEDIDTEIDDAEYSQVFNDVTIPIDPETITDDVAQISSATWNDSFWNDANIPQLDGTFDDDHVKKVRKRKKASLKVGLSRPKTQKPTITRELALQNPTADDFDDDVINASRESIEPLSATHLKTITHSEHNVASVSLLQHDENESFTNLVNKYSEPENKKINASEAYDKNRHYEPVAGPSCRNERGHTSDHKISNSRSDSFESSPEDNDLGIVSFYNTSKLFDTSMEQKDFVQSNSPENVKIRNKSSLLNTKNIARGVSTKTEISQYTYHDVCLTPGIKPPSKIDVTSSLKKYNILIDKKSDPFFSNPKDVGEKVEIGHIILKVQSKCARDQKPFENVVDTTSIDQWRHLLFLQHNYSPECNVKLEEIKKLLAGNKLSVVTPMKKPPTTKNMLKWIKDKESINEEENTDNKNKEIIVAEELDNSQAIGLHDDKINTSLDSDSKIQVTTDVLNPISLQITMESDGSFLCFGNTGNQEELSVSSQPTVEVNHLTLLLLEVLTSVRGDLYPDPSIDAIQAVFITVASSNTDSHPTSNTEIIVINNTSIPKWLDKCVFNIQITYVGNENDLIQTVIDLVRVHDPDIMCGYEIERSSWGYVLDRSQTLGFEIVMEMSRITERNRQKRCRPEETDYERRIIGRIVFNVWRLFRHELAISSYSFENCMHEILNERVPKYSYSQLAHWWCHESRLLRWIPVEYYLTRLSGTVRMLEKLDIINRTSELARLFGLQWWEVLSRGSQFRVESLMLRAARPLNLIALSPTVKQRAAMRAPECLPLIFEPESRFYKDPVIVLDFQSLYPSMMIAYNYCFSTCIGRVQNINGDTDYEFGAWRLKIPKAKLQALMRNGLIHWSPVGVGFVKTSVRRGVLPALLRRILAARQAVKKNMKLQTDEALKKAMHSRQLGLKLIANVTYGYTAANFSGRMPCVEVGDSVVSKGRETLERAIKLVQNNKEWNAKVVYGDTDSMFVLVPGGTREEAFTLGQEIADAVTADNPSPVALKLEKVYQPCILQTKKRYVGYMYESPDQKEPVYEAKGIETVRRDGCPAGVKLLRQSLCELFETGDVSRVKRLVLATLSRLSDGSLPARELFFTREYHGPAGYKALAAAPPNEIAKRIMSRDRRAVPLRGERVYWLVTAGAPSETLVRLSRTPRELASHPQPYHVAYYATRVILPPLNRCLSLLGVNVFKWWNELNYKSSHVYHIGGQYKQGVGVGGIARYMVAAVCAGCGARGVMGACGTCGAAPHKLVAALATRSTNHSAHIEYCRQICASCTGHSEAFACENTECPVLWRRLTAEQQLAQVKDVVLQLPPHLNINNIDF